MAERCREDWKRSKDPPGELKPSLPSALPVARVTHKSSACVSCQRKRRRCDGTEDQPCSECVKLGVGCVFDRDSDGRRKPQREKAKRDQVLLTKLFDALKNWPSGKFGRLVAVIQHEAVSISDLEGIFERTAADSGGALGAGMAAAAGEGRALEPFGLAKTMGLASSMHGPIARSLEASHYPPAVQRQQLNLINMPQYLCTPMIYSAGAVADPLSRAVVSLLADARGRIMRGESVRDLLSLDGIDLELYFRPRRPDDTHNVSTMACDLARTTNYNTFPLQMNAIHSVGTFLRWLILPCAETWEMMNPLMRPLKAQVLTPHDSLYPDLIHIPQLRLAHLVYGRQIDAFTARPNWADCNWALDHEACYEFDGRSAYPKRLTASFIQHIEDIRNWSLHRTILDIFPEVQLPDNYMALHDG
ncbi:hypothetical protein DV736_g4821, partial [Chaetothyriales sp. CBS 134916]